MSTRVRITKTVANTELIKKQLLSWGNKHPVCLALDSNKHRNRYTSFDFLLAVDAVSELKLSSAENAFEKLENYYKKTQDYIFGSLSYDLKNDTEALISNNNDDLRFSSLYFFQAAKLFILKGNELTIEYLTYLSKDITTDYIAISAENIVVPTAENTIQLKNRISKESYIKTVKTIKQHIQKGDLYEMNFCQEFYAHATINPLTVYNKLNHISKAPFAAYFKENTNYLLCSSPERFIKKNNDTLLSQPIKGTAKRSKNKDEDIIIQEKLAQDAKEHAENIMIVDLVRNDMAKIAVKNSVTVPELCKIYSFEQVHQMISTVTCKLKKGSNPIASIKALFPMGSMTGAPKIAAMKLIEQYETSKRGYYSGAVGYITPRGDFDFNVIIRSLLYNTRNNYLSCTVGGAITAASIPEKEYEECLVKAKGIFEVLSE